MQLLSRYLMRHTAIRLAVVLFTFDAFALLFDLVDASEDLLRDPTGIWRGILLYVGLRLPSLTAEILPFAVVIGSLFAVADLMRHREIVVIWGAGLSPLDIARRLAPLAALLAAFAFVNADFAVPQSATALRAWGIGQFRYAPRGEQGRYLWVQLDGDVLRVDAAGVRRRALHDVAIFRRDARGVLIERIEARRARPRGSGLELEEVVRYPVGTGRAIREARMHWPKGVDLEAMELMARPASELSLVELTRIIAAAGYGMRSVRSHRSWWHHRLAGALVPAALLLLPFALLREFRRTGGATRLFVEGITVSFLFQILDGVAVALGEGGFLPPALAGWAAPVALVSLLVALLARGQRGFGPTPAVLRGAA